ncbi:hypothetical protein [Foetidibacter luteolus]|uniref:hypothetical protein n=1 Tax=Foetidibacter luteolus TaxID=2608880 RepID=UPI00129BAE32|nr:hypothetical protein [Foetidibacter luteolus]
MDNLLYIGQWQGFFKYGPEYGTIVEGQEAEFRLFIEEYKDGQFSGRIIDWEGIGTNGEVSVMKGFIHGNIVSFTKQYHQSIIIDEWGNSSSEEGVPGHTVIYEGHFDKKTNHFVGKWEIVKDLAHAPDLTIEEVYTGTWRMHRHK